MKRLLIKLIECQKLTFEESRQLMHGIAHNEMNEAQIAAVLTAFIIRSISIDELRGFRQALIDLAVRVNLNNGYGIDLCGTGGDGKNTFNISTASSFVVAAAGYPVIKHGNYGATSVSGSSNVMEHFGYKFSNDEGKLQRELDSAGICFLHAPLFHPALKAVGPTRKQLGIKTFFNILGPLVNPANPHYQLSGVYSIEAGRIYSYFLQAENKKYIVVHSTDGYDEVSLTAPVRLFSQKGETIMSFTEKGFKKVLPSDVSGGNTIAESAEIFISVLENRATPEQNAIVLANSALAISCIDETKSIEDSIDAAAETIKSGKASIVFKKLIKMQ
ncbi:MAG TPA: anthranilate phosphoribosyltransferase [Bacteroidales bacterium]|nr:anthranilate phosphoribosyltransferase [Bacteroidales bacterium]